MSANTTGVIQVWRGDEDLQITSLSLTKYADAYSGTYLDLDAESTCLSSNSSSNSSANDEASKTSEALISSPKLNQSATLPGFALYEFDEFDQGIYANFNAQVWEKLRAELIPLFAKKLTPGYLEEPEQLTKQFLNELMSWREIYARFKKQPQGFSRYKLLRQALLTICYAVLNEIYTAYAQQGISQQPFLKNRELLVEFINSALQAVFLGYSGGQDSLLLAVAVSILVPQAHQQLIYIDHALASNQTRSLWEQLSASNLEKLGIPQAYQCVSLASQIVEIKEKQLNLEAWARDKRYQALAQQASSRLNKLQAHLGNRIKPWATESLQLEPTSLTTLPQNLEEVFNVLSSLQPILLTGHHRDDANEQFLFSLQNGAGLEKLSQGIRSPMRMNLFLSGNEPPNTAKATYSDEHQSWFNSESHNITLTVLRPLLAFKREEISTIIGLLGLPFATDPMNRDEAYTRVRYRNFFAAEPQLQQGLQTSKELLQQSVTFERGEVINLMLEHQLLVPYGQENLHHGNSIQNRGGSLEENLFAALIQAGQMQVPYQFTSMNAQLLAEQYLYHQGGNFKEDFNLQKPYSAEESSFLSRVRARKHFAHLGLNIARLLSLCEIKPHQGADKNYQLQAGQTGQTRQTGQQTTLEFLKAEDADKVLLNEKALLNEDLLQRIFRYWLSLNGLPKLLRHQVLEVYSNVLTASAAKAPEFKIKISSHLFAHASEKQDAELQEQHKWLVLFVHQGHLCAEVLTEICSAPRLTSATSSSSSTSPINSTTSRTFTLTQQNWLETFVFPQEEARGNHAEEEMEENKGENWEVNREENLEENPGENREEYQEEAITGLSLYAVSDLPLRVNFKWLTPLTSTTSNLDQAQNTSLNTSSNTKLAQLLQAGEISPREYLFLLGQKYQGKYLYRYRIPSGVFLGSKPQALKGVQPVSELPQSSRLNLGISLPTSKADKKILASASIPYPYRKHVYLYQHSCKLEEL